MKIKSYIYLVLPVFLIVLGACTGKKPGKGMSDPARLDSIQAIVQIDSLDRLIRKNPQKKSLYSKRGELQIEVGNYQEAVEDLLLAIKLVEQGKTEPFTDLGEYVGPDYWNLGRAYYGLGEYEGARDAFSAAIRLNHRVAEAYAHRGLQYAAERQYRLAIREMDTAIMLDSSLSMAWENRGFFYDYTLDFPKAINDYKKALEINPENPNVLASIGYVQLRAGDMRMAEEHLTKSVELDPDNVLGLTYLGILYLEEEKYEKALDLLERRVKINSYDPRVYFFRGTAKRHLGDHEGSCADYQIAAEMGSTLGERAFGTYCLKNKHKHHHDHDHEDGISETDEPAS